MKLLSRVQLLATPWTAAHQAPPSMGFSRQEYWSGVPLPSLRGSLRPEIFIRLSTVLPKPANKRSSSWLRNHLPGEVEVTVVEFDMVMLTLTVTLGRDSLSPWLSGAGFVSTPGHLSPSQEVLPTKVQHPLYAQNLDRMALSSLLAENIIQRLQMLQKEAASKPSLIWSSFL